MERTTKAIQSLRASMGISQEAFARAIDCTLRSVQKYEAGRMPEPRQMLSLLRLAQQHQHHTDVLFAAELRRALGADPGKRLVI